MFQVSFAQIGVKTGFTLAELLIALAILGVIATFTIPKVITAQQNRQANSIAKEAASMIAAAYQQALLSGTWTTNTASSALSQYMNYVSVLPSGSSIDRDPGNGGTGCVSNGVCLKLHNGGQIILIKPA